MQSPQNKVDSKVKIGDVIKEITQILDKNRAMVDNTVKIISRIVPMGLEEAEVEVEVKDIGPIILIIVAIL